MTIAERLRARGLALPAAMKPPAGAKLPFAWVGVVGNRALVSGHGPTNPDGTLAQPLGKVGAEVTPEQGYEAARRTALAILTSLEQELGDLERVDRWVRAFGMVNSAPGFDRQPAVINGFSDLILELWGAGPGPARAQRRGDGRAAVPHPGGDRGGGAAAIAAASRRKPGSS